jgi:aryl-alcohol dehydrogenase-like predicted oxidoreductase
MTPVGTVADEDFKVDIYYLHAPDPATPIEDTLSAIQQLYKEGKFKRVCNSSLSRKNSN